MEILNYLINFFTSYGYIAVFLVLLACGFGIPIPEDVTLIAGGVICALSHGGNSELNKHTMIIVALAGVLAGDSVMFLLGASLGSRITRIRLLNRFITKNTYQQIQEKTHRYGQKILFFARFLPGLRSAIFIVAGVSHKVKFWRFLLLDSMAALISVPALVYIGYFFANDLNVVLSWVRHSEVLIISVILLVIAGVIFFNIYKNKRSTYSKPNSNKHN